jgi:hypothetical protein
MNLTKSNFENLNHLIGEVIVINPMYPHHLNEEEAKAAHHTTTRANPGSFGAVPLYTSTNQEEEKAAALMDVTFAGGHSETPVDPDNQLTASKRNIQGGSSLFFNIGGGEADDYHQPRRSKRLESRHNQLMTSMSQGGGDVSGGGGFH